MWRRIRVAAWTATAALVAHRQVRRRPLDDVALPAPPAVGEWATGTVKGVLGLLRCRCLVRSLVVQRWHAGNGVRRDVVIGVTAPSRGFRAHAWLDGESEHDAGEFTSLVRRSPSPRELA